jgi:hypothetical protein
MNVDTDRLVRIASELKALDEHREKLLAELQLVARGIGGAVFIGSPRGRPRLSSIRAAHVPPAPGRKRRKGLTIDIVGLLADGNAYTAGDIVGKLGLSPKKSRIATVGATLFRLVKEGRVKKDKVRGYRAA